MEKGVPTAPEQVWDTYIKAHPTAEKFQYRGLQNYMILDELCANTSATGEFALSTNLTIPGTSSTISPKQKRHQFQGGKVKGESKENDHHEISVQEMGERVREGESAREEDVRMLGGGLNLRTGKDCEAVRGVGQEGIGYGGKAGEGREEGEWVIGTSKETLASVAEGNKIGDKRGLSGAGIGGGKKQRLSTLKTVEEEEEEDEEDDDEDGGGKSDKGKEIRQVPKRDRRSTGKAIA
ncbi:hypothetical protein L873DRAFT_1847837 [Choiromyces venosus 120613-1]|uniref:Uncharacterized protein n=1 Tax=Choiromyces venosus 120613-1 TaxID=1336337 RepID=A0A3N4J6F3_9PEZI|nr:hypothetical protein L873DRAFT_1847837 [Choiromyces venosus 120613-1]